MDSMRCVMCGTDTSVREDQTTSYDIGLDQPITVEGVEIAECESYGETSEGTWKGLARCPLLAKVPGDVSRAVHPSRKRLKGARALHTARSEELSALNGAIRLAVVSRAGATTS